MNFWIFIKELDFFIKKVREVLDIGVYIPLVKDSLKGTESLIGMKYDS